MEDQANTQKSTISSEVTDGEAAPHIICQAAGEVWYRLAVPVLAVGIVAAGLLFEEDLGELQRKADEAAAAARSRDGEPTKDEAKAINNFIKAATDRAAKPQPRPKG